MSSQPSPRRQQPARSTAAESARGVGALAVTALVAGGIPVVLWKAVGWPLPHRIPSPATLRAALTQAPISDQAVVKALAVLTWLAWMQFLVCLGVEILAGLRGHLPRRIPLAGWGAQVLAARLVAAMLVLVPVSAPGRTTNLVPPTAAEPPTARVATPAIPVPQQPAAPAPLPAAQPTSRDGHARTHLVRPRDTLWDIAERYLGDPRRWPEIFERNRDRPQPDGRRLTNPNRIYPGWVLVLPGETPQSPHPAPGGTGHANRPPSATARPVRPEPPATPKPEQAAHPTTAPPLGDHHPQHPAAQGEQRQRHPRQTVELPSGNLVGISLAIAVSGALTLAWLHRRRRYRPADPEPGIRHDDPLLTATIRRLHDAARRSKADAEEEPDADDLEPIEPAADPLTLDQQAARSGHQHERPPYGTVVVGEQAGAEITVDLPAVGGMGITGPTAADVIRSAVTTTIANAHPELAEILITDDDAAKLFPDVPEVPGLTVFSDLDAAIRRLEVELIYRTRLLDQDEASDIAAVAAAHPHEPLPLLILVAASIPPVFHGRLTAALALGRNLGISAIVLGEARGILTVTVTEGGHVERIDPPGALPSLMGERARLFTLSAQEAREALATVAASRGVEPAPPPEPAGPAPDEAPTVNGAAAAAMREPEALAAASMARLGAKIASPRPITVRLFGPLRIDVLDVEIRAGLRRKARELLALLLVHPAGLTPDELVEALWPDDDPTLGMQRFRTVLGNLRSTLRERAGLPDDPIVEWSGTHYRVQAELIDCDLWRFEAALTDYTTADDPAAKLNALERATACYEGRFLQGADWTWTVVPRQDLHRRATDAVMALAKLRREADDAEGELAAYERAIALDPYAEEAYRRIMALQAQLLGPDATRRTYQHLETRLDDIDADPEEATVRLSEESLSQPNSRTSPSS